MRFAKALFFQVLFVSLLTVTVFAQRQEPSFELPEGIKENLAKRRVRAEEKEYRELIERSEEAARISEDLIESFEKTKKFSPEDGKQLERLEKVVKRIRRDLGAEDVDENLDLKEKSNGMMETLRAVKEKTAGLLTELKKTSRHSVSVLAIESSNSIMRLVKFLRIRRN